MINISQNNNQEKGDEYLESMLLRYLLTMIYLKILKNRRRF